MQFIYFTVLMFFANISNAENTINSVSQNSPLTGVPNTDPISWIASLLFIILIIFVCAFILKKTNLANFSNQYLKIISSVSVGTKEKIMIIDVNQKQYIIGVTSHQINLIDKLEEPIYVDSVQNAQISTNFSEQLKKVLTKNEK